MSYKTCDCKLYYGIEVEKGKSRGAQGMFFSGDNITLIHRFNDANVVSDN